MEFCRLLAGFAPIVSLSMASLLSAAEVARPKADWPQWRGPHRDAVSTEKGLQQQWNEQGPPLAWKASGLGEGLASVVIADGRIFTMGKQHGSEFLLALSAEDGHPLWSTKVGLKSADSPSSTPTIDGDRVYALGPQGDLICAETATGKEIWRKSYTKDFGGSLPTWKYCESPLVDGQRLICTPGSPDATLVALDKKTGALLWKTAVPNGGGSGFGYSSAVISEGAGVRQYVQLLGAGAGCVGVAAADGKLLWSYARVGNGTASIPTPIVDGDFVFCSSGYGTGSALLRLTKEGTGVKATEVYFLSGNEFQNHHGGMIHVGEYVYSGHGHNNGFPVCLELKTGRIIWGGKQRGPGSGSAAVVYADGQLYFRYQDGLMALIGAKADGYHLNGTFKIPEVSGPSWSHPVVVGGRLYLREQNNLFVYDLTKR
ncbi:MAG TPA: PQQ-binding-like beta-propeller repeat protein [Planctomycetaceae bacterium]|jgi:outer membrane protein assembly factor BamB|nr:PQQ-binding-like beta-propeller repeat protein [Planctomycetaceae bacterium]